MYSFHLIHLFHLKPRNFVSLESLLFPKTPRTCVVLNHSTLSHTMFEMQHFVQHVPHVPCCCEICHILCSAVILSDDNIFPPEKKFKTLVPLPPVSHPLLFPPFSPPSLVFSSALRLSQEDFVSLQW